MYRSKIFSTGAIVGCGIDWDAGDLFFVCLGAPNEPAEVHLHRPRLDRLPWYPAIGTPLLHAWRARVMCVVCAVCRVCHVCRVPCVSCAHV